MIHRHGPEELGTISGHPKLSGRAVRTGGAPSYRLQEPPSEWLCGAGHFLPNLPPESECTMERINSKLYLEYLVPDTWGGGLLACLD